MKVLRFLVFLPAIIWTVLIFLLSTRNSVQLPEMGLSLDKIGHFLAYGGLTALFSWAFYRRRELTLKRIGWIVVGASLYGVALEYVQWFFFPGRFFEVWDMIANITGASIAGYFSLSFTTKP